MLSSMLYQGYVPQCFLQSCIIPIPKHVKLDLSDSANYRAISLWSIIGKILDQIILNREHDQFGLKRASDTAMCSAMVTETIEYYVDNKACVYLLLIDAAKTFDRISQLSY